MIAGYVSTESRSRWPTLFLNAKYCTVITKLYSEEDEILAMKEHLLLCI